MKKLIRIFRIGWLATNRYGYTLHSQDVVPLHVEKGGRAGGVINWNIGR